MAGAWKTIKELHRETTLGAKEGVAFRYFSRPLASFILYFIKGSRITPNQVTIASLIVAIFGSIIHLSFLSYWGLLVGGAMFMIAHVLDALDGQLARLRKAGSEVGMHFDFFIDELKAYLMLVALTGRLYLQNAAGDVGFSLLWPLTKLFGPVGILAFGLIGLLGLSVGISCTKFYKLQAWKEAFPPPPAPEPEHESDEATVPAPEEAPPPTARRLVALAEKAGKFIIDYPSYIIILCALNRVDLYLILYTAAVCLYSARALWGISLRLWRVDPYSELEAPEVAQESPAPEEAPSEVEG